MQIKKASSEAKMQGVMDENTQSCDKYDLTISTKRQRLYTNQQMENRKPYNEPTIAVNGQKLTVVDKFIYLLSTLSTAVQINDEITARIANASMALGILRANVWERNGILV